MKFVTPGVYCLTYYCPNIRVTLSLLREDSYSSHFLKDAMTFLCIY